MNKPQPPTPGNQEIPSIPVIPVGRVSPQGVTRQAGDGVATENVGLRCANPTYTTGWESFHLADLAKFKYGKFLAKTDLHDAGFPVFSCYGVVGYLPTYQFNDPQLLIVCRGEGGTGDVKMSPPKCSITNLSIVISPNDERISQKFLYWALKASDTHRLRTGSAQAQIVIGVLEKLKLNVPPNRLEQDYIANILDTLDDRITLLRDTLLPRLISGQLRLPDAETRLDENSINQGSRVL